MRTLLVGLLLTFSSTCTAPPAGEALLPPQNVSALPPDEEFIERPAAQSQEAADKAEPLSPDPQVIADFELTPEAVREWEANVHFHRGDGPVDLDGNGTKEATSQWENGLFTYSVDENDDGRPDHYSDGTRTVSDDNFDGTPDYYSDGIRAVSDFDYDGKPDLVVTTTRRANGGDKVVQERDADGDGVFEERYTTEQLSRTWNRITQEHWDGSEYVIDEQWLDPSVHVTRIRADALEAIGRSSKE